MLLIHGIKDQRIVIPPKDSTEKSKSRSPFKHQDSSPKLNHTMSLSSLKRDKSKLINIKSPKNKKEKKSKKQIHIEAAKHIQDTINDGNNDLG